MPSLHGRFQGLNFVRRQIGGKVSSQVQSTERSVLTVAQVAAELQICAKSVYRLLERGKLKAIPHLRVNAG